MCKVVRDRILRAKQVIFTRPFKGDGRFSRRKASRGFFNFFDGEAEIDDQDAFLTNYQSDLKKSILFQVPHHGSDENWKDWFSEYQPFCNLWPVTHNVDHKYGNGTFPSATFSYIAPYSVIECEPTRLGIQIHFDI